MKGDSPYYYDTEPYVSLSNNVWQSFHLDLGVGYTYGCFIIICKQHTYTFSNLGYTYCISKIYNF